MNTATNLRKLGDYIRLIANRMKLADWKFILDSTPSDAGTYAQIACADSRKSAVVRVSDTFFEETQDEQRHTVCHELIHPHFHQVFSVAHDVTEYLPSHVAELFVKRLNEAVEYGVDGLADAFACTLPTPAEVFDEMPEDEIPPAPKPRRRKR